MRSPDSICVALSDAYPWVKHPPREGRDLFAEELTREPAAETSVEVLETVALLVDSWKLTA